MSHASRDDWLVVIGIHTPEFSFEHDIDLVRDAVQDRDIDHPVAVDDDYDVWTTFANHYWPALLQSLDRYLGVAVGEHLGYAWVEGGDGKCIPGIRRRD